METRDVCDEENILLPHAKFGSKHLQIEFLAQLQIH